MTESKIKKRVKDIYYKYTGIIKQKKLKNKTFSIISNNCFGGVIYRNNHLIYNSPTCGMFFMAPEYIKFIYNIKKYVDNVEIKEIRMEDSKYARYLIERKYNGIIGKIDDVEICFLHYSNINEINQKWNRRSKRINWNNIIYKFNDQNLCTYKELEEFYRFNAKNKICFTAKKYEELKTIQLKKYKKNEYVLSDTNPRDYKKEFNVYNYINNIERN